MAPLLNTNIQAFTLTVSTLLKQPSHFLPNLTIPTFLDFPEQDIGAQLASSTTTTIKTTRTTTTDLKSISSTEVQASKKPSIKALILDKDNTFCPPNTTHIPGAYMRKLISLRTSPTSPFNMHQNPHGVLIVSNTAGSRPDSARYENEARALEAKLKDLRISVFRVQKNPANKDESGRRKPFCAPDVLAWLKEKGVVESAEEVVVVGDRLGTDTLMAAQMGAWSVWCKDGVKHGPGQDGDEEGRMDYRGFLAKVETVLERYLRENRGVKARVPEGW